MKADSVSVKDSVNPSSDDPLRDAIRAAVDASSAQAIAIRAGVSDETVYALLRGARIGKGSRRLLEDTVKNPVNPPEPEPTTTGPTPGSPAGYVLIPAIEAAYHRGVLDAGIRTISNVMHSLDAHAESLRALRGLLSGTTAGLTGIADAGVLPGPGPNAQPVTTTTTPEEGAALVEHYRQIGVAERERREREARERETPRRKRGVGG